MNRAKYQMRLAAIATLFSLLLCSLAASPALLASSGDATYLKCFNAIATQITLRGKVSKSASSGTFLYQAEQGQIATWDEDKGKWRGLCQRERTDESCNVRVNAMAIELGRVSVNAGVTFTDRFRVDLATGSLERRHLMDDPANQFAMHITSFGNCVATNDPIEAAQWTNHLEAASHSQTGSDANGGSAQQGTAPERPFGTTSDCEWDPVLVREAETIVQACEARKQGQSICHTARITADCARQIEQAAAGCPSAQQQARAVRDDALRAALAACSSDAAASPRSVPGALDSPTKSDSATYGVSSSPNCKNPRSCGTQ